MSKPVTFSEKYDPLFNLLLARETVEDLSYKGLDDKDLDFIERSQTYVSDPHKHGLDSEDVAALKQALEEYRSKGLNSDDLEVFNSFYPLSKVDTVLMSGGRDSGKTYGLGCFVGVATSQFDHRILYTRQTMTSTKNSISKALENRLETLGIFKHYRYANYEYKYTGASRAKGLISITGQKTSSGTQTAKLKSIEDYSVFITDEGEELVNFADWNKIKRSIRAKDVQCLSIIAFNPTTRSHMIYTNFYEGIPEGFNGVKDNVLYIHTTYLDNGRENMAEHNWKEYETLRKIYESYKATPAPERKNLERKIVHQAKEYENAILGGFRDIAEGVIFEFTIGDFVESEHGNVYGADQGYTHPSTVVKVNVDKKERKIYLKEIYYETEQTTDVILESIRDEVGFSRIWADSAAALFIADLKKGGLNIKAAPKPKIKDSINAMLNYDIIIDKNSLNLQREFKEYRWSTKKEDYPVDDNNHGVDAARYAFTMIMTKRTAQLL
jgi:phage terminase large subunit